MQDFAKNGYIYKFNLNSLNREELLTLDDILIRMLSYATGFDENDIDRQDEDFFNDRYKYHYGDYFDKGTHKFENDAWVDAMCDCILNLMGHLSNDDIYEALANGAIESALEQRVWNKVVEATAYPRKQYKTESMRRRYLREGIGSSNGLVLGDLLLNYLHPTQDVKILDDTLYGDDGLIAEGTVSSVLRSGLVKSHLDDIVTGLETQGNELIIWGTFLG